MAISSTQTRASIGPGSTSRKVRLRVLQQSAQLLIMRHRLDLAGLKNDFDQLPEEVKSILRWSLAENSE